MERLHHSTVKELDKLYMQEQVERAGLPAPRAIGIDEISIRKGYNYRVSSANEFKSGLRAGGPWASRLLIVHAACAFYLFIRAHRT